MPPPPAFSQHHQGVFHEALPCEINLARANLVFRICGVQFKLRGCKKQLPLQNHYLTYTCGRDR